MNDMPAHHEDFLHSLLDPERLAHAVTPEVRDRARNCLGIKRVETMTKQRDQRVDWAAEQEKEEQAAERLSAYAEYERKAHETTGFWATVFIDTYRHCLSEGEHPSDAVAEAGQAADAAYNLLK